jgi:DNA-binding FrmR family transcriptional regulator
MELTSPELKTDLTTRLRRIEGQVRGVQRMIDDGRECPEILQQMAAIRSATYRASLVLARAYAARCLQGPQADSEAMLDTLIDMMGKLE